MWVYDFIFATRFRIRPNDTDPDPKHWFKVVKKKELFCQEAKGVDLHAVLESSKQTGRVSGKCVDEIFYRYLPSYS